MRAPDKIYVPQHNIEAGDIQELNELIVACSTEYIRKDALLEWIQEVRAIPHENAIVRDLAFQEVINKLNSM